ncbi:MAG TPA: M57 family metalloprotease [Nitrosopumilaceae archaeon]|nr:M57 family metalloprotease [Nitrosopumilaceae archaeon]
MTTSSHVDKINNSNFDRKDPLEEKIDDIQEKIRSLEESNHQFNKKIILKSTILICIVSIIVIFMLLENYIIPLITNTQNKPQTSIGYKTQNLMGPLSTGYEIQNLKGDKVNTWVSWRIVKGDLFHIHILASALATDERMNMINDVIYSTKTSVQDGSEYYQGWLGALETINSTEYSIPLHFHTVTTDTGTGNILIRLTDASSPDGYSGYTTSMTDDSNHQILKSTVTIYNVNDLSSNDFKLVLRHELGHAFGLAHSDDPNDLMSAQISRDYPYISQCDVETLASLYNGNEKSHVICTK